MLYPLSYERAFGRPGLVGVGSDAAHFSITPKGCQHLEPVIRFPRASTILARIDASVKRSGQEVSECRVAVPDSGQP
jgi:hypothetical protein